MIKVSLKQLMDNNYLQNKSFDRLREALSMCDNIEESVAYNVVDSVVYIKNPHKVVETEGYKAIYNTVLVNTSKTPIKILMGSKIQELIDYDDSKDFGYSPVHTSVRIEQDEVLIIETMEPYKIVEYNQMILAYVSKYNGIK